MGNNFWDFRTVNIHVNNGKDIVIFPYSKCETAIELADGTLVNGMYIPAYYPIELKYPYTRNELAEKIKYGIEQWDKYPCYDDKKEKQTYEEKYYGINGFKNAVKGNRYFNLGWDELQGKFVTLSLPCKKGYAYLGITERKLSDDADWFDFADIVIELIDMDLSELGTFKTFKSKLNL